MNPIIVALDVDSAAEARRIVDAISGATDFYKVGMELYAAAGMEFVRELKARGCRVFLDMKYYDIGETVKRAVAVVAKAGVDLLTVHAQPQVMRAAIEGRGATSSLKILGVTVLTSFDQSDIAADGHDGTIEELVALRVNNAKRAGVDGIVCSPLEVKRFAGQGLITVVPGVRSAGTSVGDQKRVATPGEAMRDGASYLVIGRQVTRARDPKAEVEAILAEIQT
jgi:orotidine-5'-phosphate decarboxylase